MQAAQRAGQLLPVVGREAAGAQHVLVEPPDRPDHPQRELRRAHFHREHGDRLLGHERDVLADVERERGVVRDDVVVGDVEPVGVADGDALARRLARRLDGGERQPLLPLPALRQATLLVRQQEQRTGLGMADVADPGPLARPCARRRPAKVRLLVADRTPAAQRAHQFGDIIGELLARVERRTLPQRSTQPSVSSSPRSTSRRASRPASR